MTRRLVLLNVLSLLSVFLLASPAQAWSPSFEFRTYQSVSSNTKARKDIPIWWVLHGGGRYAGVAVELRGMVDGTMVVNGERSFVLRVGVNKMQVMLGKSPFDASRGTSIWCITRVLNSGTKVPPDMQYVAMVRAEEMFAWEQEQERRAQRLATRHHRFLWTQPWPTESVEKQEDCAAAWMQSFNPSLDNDSAHCLSRIVLRTSKTYDVDPRFVLSLMAAESAFQIDAVSSSGARGLGQLMPDTAARLGVRDSFNAVENADGSIRFLKELFGMWNSAKNALSLVLASYNAGPGAVRQYNGIPPYEETRSYVAYVLALYHELGGKGE